MSAAAVIILRGKRLVRRFREEGATDQTHAVTLEVLGERRSWIFDEMLLHGVFCAAGEGRFYLNERAAAEFFRKKLKRVLLIGGLLALLFFLLWINGLLGK